MQLQFYQLELLNNMFEDIDKINQEVEKFQSNSPDEIEQFRIAFLGKKGKVTLLFSAFKEVPVDEKINGHSHIRSMFFNSSENIPVKDNKLLVGKWKRLFFVELDPVRERELIVTFINGNI